MGNCKNTRAVLLMNYMLCVGAYPQINNRFKTQIQNKWNGFWVIRFGQMLNLGVEKKLLDAALTVPSVALTTQCPKQSDFNEDVRAEIVGILQSNSILVNSLAVAQTSLNLLNAPAGKALGAISYKGISPIGWYEKGDKITDWAAKAEQFKKSIENPITYGKFFVAGNAQNNAVEAYTALF